MSKDDDHDDEMFPKQMTNSICRFPNIRSVTLPLVLEKSSKCGEEQFVCGM
jgi:hypothetical protein